MPDDVSNCFRGANLNNLFLLKQLNKTIFGNKGCIEKDWVFRLFSEYKIHFWLKIVVLYFYVDTVKKNQTFIVVEVPIPVKNIESMVLVFQLPFLKIEPIILANSYIHESI